MKTQAFFTHGIRFRQPGRTLFFWYCGLALLTVVLLWQIAGHFGGAARAAFATITVNTTADDNTINGNCTLREAIHAANTNAAVDACAAGAAGADTIHFNLGAGTPTINVSASPLPTIIETLTIDGATGGATRVELNGAGAGAGANGLFVNNTDNCVIKSLVINRFNGTPGVNPMSGNGIRIVDSDNTVVENCYIGTNSAGNAALANSSNGIYGYATNDSDIKNNLLSGNGQSGVYFHQDGAGCQRNNIRGNKIGTNLAGTAAVPNAENGIQQQSCTHSIIGGTTVAERNLVSGNIGNGMAISSFHQVLGNYVGVDVTGTVALGNGNGIGAGHNNIIGGTTPEARNIISASISDGISFLSQGNGTNSQVIGNYIGTDVTGTVDLGNNRYGVYIRESEDIVIGGTTPAERNIISGNTSVGVFLHAAADCQVLGNYIGPNVNGTAAFSSTYGVQVDSGAGNHLISGNVISGHSDYGVSLAHQSNNRLFGNIIGASPTLTAMPNGIGVTTGGATGQINQIGGTGTGEGNIIAFNNEDGVQVSFSTNHKISGNSIYSNGDLGIDLNRDGVTANDAGDGDSGPNNLQNFPVITQATTTGIQFTLNSVASTTFTIEFFHNPVCDNPGNGEGKTYIGQTTVTTNANGDTPVINYPATLPTGVVVTATAADPNGNTSEFSSCRTVEARAIAGTVFEDVNYGGSAGRSQANSAGAPVVNARVELYDGAGSFVTFTTTNASGQYTLGNLAPGNFTVRVVNGSVVSTRPGGAACPNCLPVQTFRTNASTGVAVPVTDHVGGEVPSKVDAGNGSTTLAALTTATTTAQSIATVTVGSGNISGVDFGFNFDTIVNVNAAGQGSYPQFTLNAKELGGETLLAQAGMRMNICILPSHPAITPEALPAGKETTIFMIANGQARPGLNTGYANLLDANGVATILLTAFTTVRGDHTNIDGTTQTFNVSDTNSVVLGTGGMVGGENNVPLPRLNGPEVQLLVTNPAVNYVIGAVGNHVTIRGMGVQGAGGGWDIYYIDFNSSNNDFALVEQNVLGASAADFIHIGIERNQENLHITSGSTGAIVRCNLMKDAGDMNLHLANSTFGVLVEGNEFNRTVGYPSNPELQTGGPGIRMESASQNTIRGNLFLGAQRGGIQLLKGAGGTGCTFNIIGDNTFTENLIGGVVVTSGASQVPAAISQANKISRNSFYNNTGLAIDLNPLPLIGIYAPPEFVTPNDGLLNNLMPNQGADYPVFTSATLSGSTLAVQGYVGNNTVGTPFNNTTVEVYVADNIPADQNGAILIGGGQNVPHGEGRYYIGACVTDPNSLFNCTITVPTNVTITPGITQITATATRVLDTSEFGPNQLVGCPAITLAPTSLPNGFTGTFYTQTIQALPALGVYNYAVTSGMPPTGLVLDNATGVLEGVPSVPGYYSFTVTATLVGTSCSIQQPYTIFINCPGATITVTGTADGPINTLAGNGTCDLREAIAAANGISPVGECPAGATGANSDFIYFWIGTGTPTINITAALPALTGRVVIDGSKCQSTRVELNGVGAGAGVNGLELTASNSAILSLVINRFSLDGLVIANSSNNVVENCLIGTDATGVLARPNRDGILLNNATNNRIGGSLAGQRNLISGNNRGGLLVNQANGNQVLGNLVGTDISGSLDLGNTASGLVLNFSDNCTVGGAATGAGNVFSGNNGHGVVVQFSSNTLVLGNKIGTDGSGTVAAGNGLDGVIVVATSQNNRIGGNPNEANVIAFNGRNGVTVNDNFGPAFNNAILTNSIHSNVLLGIDLAPHEPLTLGVTLNDAGDGDDGPNRFQNFPVLLNVTANQIQGTLDSAPGTYTLQFFNNTACDPSQHGEGQTFIGEMQFTVTGNGPQLFNFVPSSTLTAHDFITATATDSLGNTSEFSECHECEICPTITLTPATLPNGAVGAAYNQTITANGGTPPHTFILSSDTTAPPGLTLSSAGVLSGTPTQQGSFTFLVKAFAKDGCFGLQQYTVTIGCTSFTLTPATLPNGETGTMYSQTIGSDPVGAAANFTVTGGMAPPGLTLEAATGVLSGMPTTPGYYTFTVTAGGGSCTASRNYVVFINCNGATITVTTAADTVAADGGCSLREAIQAASGNAAVNECPAGVLSPNRDVIYFALGTGVPAINVVAPLPAITERVLIDGSQCQATRVELNGTGAGANANGLLVTGGNSTIRFLVINRFSENGIALSGAGGNFVESCFLGVNAAGTAALANGRNGLFINGSPNNLIGGFELPAPGFNIGNLISGNTENGVLISGAGATGNLLQGNYFGLDGSGLQAIGNGQAGVRIQDAPNNQIGDPSGSNFMSGNVQDGLVLFGANATGNTVQHNNIGTVGLGLGSNPIPNGRDGIQINGARDNLIGGSGPNEGNMIIYNGRAGVLVADVAGAGTGNAILTNSILLNQALGIDLAPGLVTGVTLNDTLDPDGGPNNLQNFPVVTFASFQLVQGTLHSKANTTYRIEAFASGCHSSGYGPGHVPLGVTDITTDANGNASFSLVPNNNNFTVGISATATATELVNGVPRSTSEFSACQTLVDCLPITVNPPTLNNGTASVPYSQTLTASGGLTPYSFALRVGTLPGGLTLNPTSGVIAGTPTSFGVFNFTVEATDAGSCTGTRAYTLNINEPCQTITVNPATLPNGFVGAAYNQTFSAKGGATPYTFARVNGTLPPGLALASSGALTGTPTTAGSFTFRIQATDASGCTSTPREYTVIISGSGLQFYPLPSSRRALETRPGFDGDVTPGAPILANTTLTLVMRTGCPACIPTNATAVTGNITVVPSFSAGGYLTLFPSNAAQPVVANSNFQPNEITNNVFTVGLGPADVAFKIFASATTHVIVDITGYFAPPSPTGLYFHTLEEPVRLVETRTLPGLTGCIKPGAPFPVGTTEVQGRTPVASPCNVIPATARAIMGNVTVVLPPAQGFLTIWPSDAIQPTVAGSNYLGADVINGPFTVKLGTDGKFKVFTPVATDLVIDILGYYSTEAMDTNGAGLLFNILPKPIRELETRPDFPGFPPLTGCSRPNAPIQGGTSGIRTQPIWGTCDGVNIPNVARAIMGNVTVVNPATAGFLTHYPGNVGTPPTVATSNYPFPVVFGYNRHFTVGLSPTDGTFKILTQATTELIVDVSGYFAP